ncbi:Hypothetical predicted protein [Cloeon dipterum]|uniref:Proteasome subunit beta n=3 Tax=Cloeon TaxID=197151 RepID=A0A8S1CX51_9INSE|nr:Hypothetical predicted protein [Cloeon dipterum]
MTKRVNTTKMAQFGSDAFAAKSFWHNGPAPGASYNFPNMRSSSGEEEMQRSQTPITTGTSVLGLKFDNGVIICADTLGSYGSLARFRDCQRVMKVNNNIAVGVGGDYADFQYLKRVIDQKIMDEHIADDGFALKPKALYTWLTRVMYNRRNKFDPLWNNYVVGGMQEGVPFLGAVDLRGMAYQDRHIATGYGSYIALPLLRDAADKNPNMSLQQAKEIMEKCLEVLYYRDARSFPKYQMAIVTAEGVTVSDVLEVKSNWEVAHMISGF